MRPIVADRLKETLKGLSSWSKRIAVRQIEDCMLHDIFPRLIDDEPTADVQPVKHGKWKHVAGMNSKCSVCSHYFPVTEFDSRPFDINYCPDCGAKMDGD